MSHFTVIVFGNDAEKQLKPYNENQDDLDDDDIVLVDQIGMVNGQPPKHGTILAYLREAMARKEVIALIEKDQRKWYTSALAKNGVDIFVAYNEKGKLCVVERPYADDGKWDWYELGGRWDGLFMPKPGAATVINPVTETQVNLETVLGTILGVNHRKREPIYPGGVNVIYKRDIDLEGMQAIAVKEATERWNKFERLTEGESWMTWTQVLEHYKPASDMGIASLRDLYHGQAVIKRIQQADPAMIYNIDDFAVGRDAYLNHAKVNAMLPFAFIHEGRWEERAQMGWFGRTSGDIDLYEWQKRFQEVFDSVPDDTLLSLFDCHI